MARRQPYEHNATPPDALAEQTADPFKTDALEIILEDTGDIQVAESPKKEEKSEPIVIAEAEPEQRHEPVKPSADDEAYNRLKSQLDREKQAHEAARKRAQDLEAQHTSIQERLREERERQVVLAQENLESQAIAIENAISFAESQAAQAQREISRALNEGDYDASSNAYRALAKAESDLSRLRDGKSAIEAQKNTPVARRDPPQPTQPQAPQNAYERIEQYITQPAHSLRAQQYMRDHYDDLFRDFETGANRLSKLVGGHWLAKSDGVVENSDAYFDFLDRHMGYKGDPAPSQRAPTPQAPAKKSIPPSAPVSRSTSNDSVSGTSITLSKAEVDFCHASGIKPSDYARNKLVAMKGANDPGYSGPRFTNDR